MHDLSRLVAITWMMAYSSLRREAGASYGGLVWWMIEPLVHVGVFYLLFAVILQTRTEDFVLFLFAGIVSWRWMQTSVMAAATSIRSNRQLIQQVYVPKPIIPLKEVTFQTMKSLVAMGLLLVTVMIINGIQNSIVYLPLVLLVELTLIVCVGFVVSALVPLIPDLRNVITLLFRGLFFLSGIFFDVSRVPEDLRFYLYLNPMVTIIESMRDALIYDRVPDLAGLLLIAAASLALGFIGLALHARFDYEYPRLTM